VVSRRRIFWPLNIKTLRILYDREQYTTKLRNKSTVKEWRVYAEVFCPMCEACTRTILGANVMEWLVMNYSKNVIRLAREITSHYARFNTLDNNTYRHWWYCRLWSAWTISVNYVEDNVWHQRLQVATTLHMINNVTALIRYLRAYR